MWHLFRHSTLTLPLAPQFPVGVVSLSVRMHALLPLGIRLILFYESCLTLAHPRYLKLPYLISKP